MKLEGAKIMITGGSSGLGKAMAEVLKEAGAIVLITGRNEEKVNEVASVIDCFGMAFDVSDYSILPEKVSLAVEMLGGIDVLINNAGIGEFPVLGEIQIDQLNRVFGINVFGLTMLTQEVLPHFKSQQYGNILNIGSTASLKGFARGSVYAASKFALRALSQCWQAELRRENIRVIHVNPSEVPTAFNKEDRQERPDEKNKLTAKEIAHSIKAALEMDNRGFIPELSVWATNPWD